MPADPTANHPTANHPTPVDQISTDRIAVDPLLVASNNVNQTRLRAVGIGQTLAIYALMLHSILLLSNWIGIASTSQNVVHNARLYLYSFGFVLSIMAISLLARGMRFHRLKTFVSVVCQFIPLLNILWLIYLSLQAMPLLRQAGYQMGLLGLKPGPHRR
ncbi:MAG: hypothetical protein EOO68_38275 [Moraxellaceae bacterium]|nr:MAG: hypothetical protein EOO68_38275 [Moraxellaceae bacterium]